LNSIKNIATVLAAAYIIFGHAAIQEGAAQMVDVKSYQVLSGEYGKSYVDYFNAVREKIVKKLKRNYKSYYHEGDVDLFFVLSANGSLARIDVDMDSSVNDKQLIDIAVLSIQQASPFKPFPKELDERELPFSLTMSFKNNNQ
jgi:hypothetical protein